MAQKRVIELDGRTLEGGGQLLRLSVCLSALTSTPVKITNIRGNRSGGGGLKAQHLASVLWLAHACNATVTGAEKGSQTLTFAPGVIGNVSPAYTKRRIGDDGGGGGRQVWEARLDIGTAGSTGLALQAILPYVLFAPPRGDDGKPSALPVHLTITGGTNVSGSPSYDYISQILLPVLACIGLPKISTSLANRGWSHGGGSSIGSFTLLIPPRESLVLPAFNLFPADPTAKPTPLGGINATFIAPPFLHAPFRTALEAETASLFSPEPKLNIKCESTGHEKQIYLLLATAAVPSSSYSSCSPHPYPPPKDYILASDILPTAKQLPKNPARAARELAQRVSRTLHGAWACGAWVDEHLRDQLVVFQALAAGRSRVWGGLGEGGGREKELSLHARTAEWVAREILGVRFNEEGVVGVGFGRGEGGR